MTCKMDDDLVQPVEVISVATPIRPETPIDFSNKCKVLDHLMKKYPDFIPAHLLKLKKRSHPVCMFVNDMGTCHPTAVTPKPVHMAAKKSVVFEPSPYPIYMPTYRPGEKQRMANVPANKAG
jgi:hypothetical protein